MIRRLTGILFVVVVSILLSMTGCSSSGGGGITTAQAIAAAQTVNGGFYVAINNSTTSSGAITCSTTGLSLNGTSVTVGPTITDVLPITFSGYVDAATGYVVSGTINVSVVINTGTTPSTISGTMTGKLTSSGGPVTTQTWNVNIGGSGSSPTYAGTVIFNGDSFDAATLSLNGVTQASDAAIVSQNITSVLASRKSWNVSGSVSYILSPTVGMTGTFATGSPDTYALTITCTNDPDTPYTVSGSLNVSLTANHATGAIASGTVTGNLTLSGGTITTETWNISNIIGFLNSGPYSYAGTVTCNGTAFDAKTLNLQ